MKELVYAMIAGAVMDWLLHFVPLEAAYVAPFSLVLCINGVVMNKIKLSLVATLLVLSGCSTTKTMNGIMSSWVGSNIDEVVTQWGYPHEQREFRGRTLYVWNQNRTLTLPQITSTTANVYGNTVYAQSTTTGGNTTYWNCQRILEVDSAGTVVSYQWSGNNCPFGEIMQYSNWRKKGTK